MTLYVLVADSWSRAVDFTDTFPTQPKKYIDYSKGDEIELDPENDLDSADIDRLTVQPRPALVEKEVYDEINAREAAVQVALARARAATFLSPHSSTDSMHVVADSEGNGPFPEGSRVDAASTTVGAGGTDPEPGGFTGEAGGVSYDDSDGWPYPELQSAARARGLSAGGSRVDLVARLREFDSTQTNELTRKSAAGELEDPVREAPDREV